jgi:hypothetical protein
VCNPGAQDGEMRRLYTFLPTRGTPNGKLSRFIKQSQKMNSPKVISSTFCMASLGEAKAPPGPLYVVHTRHVSSGYVYELAQSCMGEADSQLWRIALPGQMGTERGLPRGRRPTQGTVNHRYCKQSMLHIACARALCEDAQHEKSSTK